jgi:hypothetical protein
LQLEQQLLEGVAVFGLVALKLLFSKTFLFSLVQIKV